MPVSVEDGRVTAIMSSEKSKPAEQLNVDVHWFLVLYAAHCYPKLAAHSFFQPLGLRAFYNRGQDLLERAQVWIAVGHHAPALLKCPPGTLGIQGSTDSRPKVF